MKPVIIIAIAVGILVVSVFAISEIIWYFANQEFEKARDEFKESLVNTFEKQYESIPEQEEATPTSRPENAGALDSDHVHVAIIVNIFGDEFDFSAPSYQIKSSWIHFEGRDGSTIHKHATGVTYGYLFETLSLGLDKECFVFQDGRSFCTNEDYTLRFFINGEQHTDIRYHEGMEGDKVLILYGGQTSEEVEKVLNELEKQTIIN